MRKEGYSILSVLPWETKLVSVRVWFPWVTEFGSRARSPATCGHFRMCPRFCAKHHAYSLSVQFSVSDSLWPHGLQHARPPCPLPASGAYSNLCPLRRWCHPTISSSVVPFSSCLQSFPVSGSFLFFLIFIFTLFYFTVLYWFCHTLTWIHHGCTCVPKREPPSHLPPHNISLGHPSNQIITVLCQCLTLLINEVSL